MNPNLEPITPDEAKEMYLQSRSDELAERSLELQEKHVRRFVEWCDNEGLDDMNSVTARTVHRYHLDKKSGWATSTVSINLSTVRRFVRFCESIDGVAVGVAEKIEVPSNSDSTRDEKLEFEEAEEILAYLRKFHYSSRTHALISLLWHTGLRTGTIFALDLGDFDRERERLRIRHRPETGTPLKNKEAAERFVALSPEVVDVLSDYIDEHRHEVTDEHGRPPLFTTRNGRAPKNTIRRNIYAVTRPCKTGRGCPHRRDPKTCEGAGRANEACKCPSSMAGHAVRRGAITHFLRSDVPEKVVSGRMNVSRDILDRHYDRRTEDEKAEQRRSFLSNV